MATSDSAGFQDPTDTDTRVCLPCSHDMPRHRRAGEGPYPELCVFDLDACLWDKDIATCNMYLQASSGFLIEASLPLARGRGVVLSPQQLVKGLTDKDQAR